MSDEKIDLARIAAYERGIIRQITELAMLGQLSPMHQEILKDARARLALVRLARAVRALRSLRADASADELDAALAPFTDSAEVDDGR